MSQQNKNWIQNASFVLHAIDYFASAIEIACQFIEDNTVRPIINVLISAAHMCTSIARFVLDIISNNVLNITLSCAQLIISTGKLISAFLSISPDEERFANCFKPLHLGLSISHCFFTAAHATTRGIQFVAHHDLENSQSNGEPQSRKKM